MAGIPLSDDYPVRRVPVVSYLLITANVLVYLLSPLSLLATWYGIDLQVRACALENYLLRWAVFPTELLAGEQLSAASSCAGSDITKVVWLSPATAMFLHGDVFHLLSNMVYLFVFGPVVEDRLGRTRYTVLYVASGVLATYAFALTQPGSASPMLGASGAISGILGAYLAVQFRSRITTLIFFILPIRLPGWILVLSYFALQYFLYISVALFPGAEDSGVAYAAHVYGFIAGFLGGAVIYRIRWRSGRRLSDVH